MLEAAKKAGVRVALISPNAVQVRGGNNQRLATYLKTQREFYAPLKGLAEKYGVPFVDQYAVTRAALEKIAHDDPDANRVNPFPGGVHTSPAGGLLMAHTILTGLHAPALVSDVSIDAAAGAVAFDRTDEALPLPVQKEWLAALPYVNGLKDLNWYGLRVTGLTAGRYSLAIDGQEVGAYTADELAKGVNLSNLTAGPLFEQGQKVLTAINAKNQLVHQRFRGWSCSTRRTGWRTWRRSGSRRSWRSVRSRSPPGRPRFTN